MLPLGEASDTSLISVIVIVEGWIERSTTTLCIRFPTEVTGVIGASEGLLNTRIVLDLAIMSEGQEDWSFCYWVQGALNNFYSELLWETVPPRSLDTANCFVFVFSR